MTKDEAAELWLEAQYEGCCSCHIAPPCPFCVEGFSLDLEEYLELYVDWEEDEQYNAVEAYERAMRGI